MKTCEKSMTVSKNMGVAYNEGEGKLSKIALSMLSRTDKGEIVNMRAVLR
ncbi:hypothetical protein FACS1894156_2090 [Bacteroidia bacterium]|nr:hypothetical protein FACS1894156_2090 [Bacteroidia bacterium]